jgi:hypothetical protein
MRKVRFISVLVRRRLIWLAILAAVFASLMVVSQVWAFSKWFSPDDGDSGNSTNKWNFSTLWDYDCDFFDINDAWEGELRGQYPRNINEFYCDYYYWDSDFPGRYPEHDEDDYTIGTHYPEMLLPYQWYHHVMHLYPCVGQPSFFPAIFESEWGADWGSWQDPVPIDQEQKEYWIPGYVYW